MNELRSREWGRFAIFTTCLVSLYAPSPVSDSTGRHFIVSATDYTVSGLIGGRNKMYGGQ